MILSGFRNAAMILCCACAAFPQTPAPPATPPAAPAAASTPTQAPAKGPEMATREEPALFKARVNLVVVPVVVRDKKGNAVGNLKQEDFQLFDRGKTQYIARFSMERAGGRLGKTGAKDTQSAIDKLTDEKPVELPDRFIAYLFDDVHMKFGDLVHARDAARRHIDSALRSTDRAAIYTTSGLNIQDFTDDKEELHKALAGLRMRPVTGQGERRCPTMTYYMADKMQNKHDTVVINAATLEVQQCQNLQDDPATAQRIALQAAAQELNLGDHETRQAMGVIKELVRRMAAMPGQRSIILVSNGFVTLPEHNADKTDIMDRAIRANVLVNSLDARGLYTDVPDVTRSGTNYETDRILSQMERETNRAQSDVMAELAYGTGATFVQNTNDLDGGFARLASAPEYYYLLAFSPQNLKMDGAFHSLKVTLKALKDVSASARTGYYAPKHLENAI